MARIDRRTFLAGAAAGAALALRTGPGRAADGSVYGNRVPRNWFWFQGLGVSDSGYGDDPYETFAYDLALKRGGIEDYNVIPYTSVVPKAAYGNILGPEPAADGTIARPASVAVTPGSVLEVIMSQEGMTVPAGETWTIATGLGLAWAAEPGSPDALRNGYAAEYVFHDEKKTSIAEAEGAARRAIEAALDHELSSRGLVPYAGEPGRTLVVLANAVDNATGAGPRYVTQITGIGCYGYVFPPLQ